MHELSSEGLPWAVLPREYQAKLRLPGAQEPLDISIDRPPLASAAGQGKFRWRDPPNPHPIAIDLDWRATEEPGHISFTMRARGATLLLCHICGKPFKENKANTILHSHGRGFGLRHVDLSQEHPDLVAELELDVYATLRGWQSDFQSVTDRDKIRTYRINAEARQRDAARRPSQPDIFSRDGYALAVEEWTINLNQGKQRAAELKWLTEDARLAWSERLFDLLSAPQMPRSTPALQAVVYLGNHLSPRDNDAWYSLDRTLLIAATVYRAAAHSSPEYANLREQVSRAELQEVIKQADSACPRLLAWAFAWVELFFRVFPSQFSSSGSSTQI